MPHPFQCLLYCFRIPSSRLLVTAAGSYLRTFDIDRGVHLCTWPSNGKHEYLDTKLSKAPLHHDEAPDSPAKRVKLSLERSESSSAEIVVDETEVIEAPNPPILKLAATSNGQYVVAISGEDKCIRVFELSAGGILNLYSERLKDLVS